MSIDYSIYVGPVVRCKRTKGAPKYPLDDTDGGFGFMAMPDDGAAPKGEHVYWVNFMNGAPRKFHISEEADYFEPLSCDTREGDIQWMREKFADDLVRLYAIYGVQNVTLDWGVFGWTS